jgi:hypothetical protein
MRLLITIIINIAVCDALQNEDLSRISGYDRIAFCDSHGLSKYRVVETELISKSTTRERADDSTGTEYIFRSNGTDSRSFEVRKFLK